MKVPYTFSVLLFATFFWVVWVGGAVIAKGFWSTFACIFFFPWSWYLVIEKAMASMGWL
jgi:hypothetical protein